MFSTILTIVLSMVYISSVNGECANACNGHGKCTSYDMCLCHRNWMANDCSQRVCQFGLAHVDTPKGDLDMSGSISGPDSPVIDNDFTYPYGTTEQFPAMRDSDLKVLDDSAHFYMECSNKGSCDRSSGQCSCFEGYDGVACQRASCPGYPASCSGHGVCKSKKQLAESVNNVYKLWDQDTTMGCQCDAGYYGPDCSLRQCKYGVDPVFLDDAATVKYSIFDVAILTTAATSADFHDGAKQRKQGYWAIRFFDNHGEDWVTERIIAGASCEEVVNALESLPNDVIPEGSTYCTRDQGNDEREDLWSVLDQQQEDNQASVTGRHYKIAYNMSIWEANTNALFGEQSNQTGTLSNTYSTGAGAKLSGYIYRLKFFGKPGYLKEPQVVVHLDGLRPSLSTDEGEKVITKVWTDGQQGEDFDYFADHCDNVKVWIDTVDGPFYYLKTQSSSHTEDTQLKLLKYCLGASDFDNSNNGQVYNWDFGNIDYPHIIKLVRSTTTYTDGGYYVVIYWDNVALKFRLVNPFTPPDGLETDLYEVYTTTGTLARVSNASQATFSFASKRIFTANITYDEGFSTPYDGDVSCEIGDNNVGHKSYVTHCLNRSDIITFLSWNHAHLNPPHINLYTVQKLGTEKFLHSVSDQANMNLVASKDDVEMHYQTHVIETDLSTNWGTSLQNSPRNIYHIYKFFPRAQSTYHYVAECSNRGICQTDTALCSCFPGYTNDDCSVQNSLFL